MRTAAALLLLLVAVLPGERGPAADPAEVPEDLELVRDVRYGTGGDHDLYLDVLRSRVFHGGPFPVLIWLHAGGARGGSKTDGIQRLIPYAREGYFCASLEYRSPPAFPFPAAIEDCKCAVRAIRARAARLNVDPDRIGVWGECLGGYLAALMGTSARVSELEGVGEWRHASSRVSAVCAWSAATDLVRLVGPSGDARVRDAVADVLGVGVAGKEDLVCTASPVTYASRDDPPFLLVHSEADAVVPPEQSRALWSALREVGVEAEVCLVPGNRHGDLGADAAERTQAFFDRQIGLIARLRSKKYGREWLLRPADLPDNVRHEVFYSRLAGSKVSCLVYVPPGYEESPDRHYPVLYWLHDAYCFPQSGLPFIDRLDDAIKQGEASAMLVVLANGVYDSLYCDRPGGGLPVASVVLQDLVPHVDATYRTIPRGEARALEGFGAAGFGALCLGFGHPDTFGAVSCFEVFVPTHKEFARGQAGPVERAFGDDSELYEKEGPWRLARVASRTYGRRHAVRLVVGGDSRFCYHTLRYSDRLEQVHIPHELHIVPDEGHHYGGLYEALGPDGFGFYRRLFDGLTPPARTTPSRDCRGT
jgi:acetyl esterase/lipase